LRLLLSARVGRALGRVLTSFLLGLLRLLLRCRNHLKYGALSCGCYTYAYEMIECNSNYIITIPKLKGLADCPQPKGGPSAVLLRRPTRTNCLSGQFQIYTADCPLQNSRLSAVQLRKTTRGNDASGQVSNPTGGPSGPPWRTIRGSLIQSTRDGNVSGQNPRPYGGLSALQ